MTVDYKNFSLEELNQKFINACVLGNLSELKYLLNDFSLREYTNTINNKNEGLVIAAENGYLDMVVYLLSSELNDPADIRYDNYKAFKMACFNGNLDIVKYLLTSQDIKEICNPCVSNGEGLKLACINGNLEVVRYLLTSPGLKSHPDITSETIMPLTRLVFMVMLKWLNLFCFQISLKIK